MKTSCFFSRRIGLTLPLILSVWANGLLAQPGSLDTGFNVTITNGQVKWFGQVGFSVAVQPDGKAIAAGTFGVMRFLTDGMVDPDFQPIPPGPAAYDIGEVALQPDGRIIVTGNFTNAAGEQLPGVLRLNMDGSTDPSFNLDSRVYPGGRVLALQPDGKVVTDGYYQRGGEDGGSLIRLRPDGSLDPDWDARSYNNSATMFALALDSIGRIYFSSSAGLFRANPDGSRDESFGFDPDAYPPHAIAVQRDGKVILGGYSDGPGLSYRPVRRLLPNGADDPDWTVPSVAGGDAVVLTLLVQPDGKVLAGGNNLGGFNGGPSANLGRLNPDGSVDATFDTSSDPEAYEPSDLALAPDGKILVAGMHYGLKDRTAPPIWRLNNDTDIQPKLDIRFTMNEGVTLRLSGQSGATYSLEYRKQLPGAGSWTSLTNLTLSGTSATWQDTTSQNAGTRFYRAVSLQ